MQTLEETITKVNSYKQYNFRLPRKTADEFDKIVLEKNININKTILNWITIFINNQTSKSNKK